MMHRPHALRLRLRFGPLATFGTMLVLVALIAGCANPNFIGVQDYGTIYGNIVDDTGKPINGALVSATGSQSTFRSGADGSFRLPQVSAGTQMVSVSATGFGPPSAPVSILVVKNTEVSVGNIVLPKIGP